MNAIIMYFNLFCPGKHSQLKLYEWLICKWDSVVLRHVESCTECWLWVCVCLWCLGLCCWWSFFHSCLVNTTFLVSHMLSRQAGRCGHFNCSKCFRLVLFVIYVKKTVQFIETLCKGDIVVRDIKQQRSIFHHYKISNFAVIHSQKNPETEQFFYINICCFIKICSDTSVLVSVWNLLQIHSITAELLPFNWFQNGGHLVCWIFGECEFWW